MNKRVMTSEIIGKAHRLMEAMTSPGTWGHVELDRRMPTWSHELDAAVKVHAGRVEDMTPVPMRGLDAAQLRLPFSPLLVELEAAIKHGGMAGRATICVLCRQVDDGIDASVFSHRFGDVWGVVGGAKITVEEGEAKSSPYGYVSGMLRSEEAVFSMLVWSTHVVATLLVMNCSNVARIDNLPPEALNRKRLKAGKLPLYTYKTLHVLSGRETSGKHDSQDSDRNSPRLHLRRGHVRRIGESRMVWVQSCLVGDPQRGRIDNAYAMERRHE
jgi:hypothetical protein